MNLIQTAHSIRRTIIATARPEITHHLGSSLSCVEILTALYFKAMNICVKNIDSLDRDIFLFSKGHAGLALYVTLFTKGIISEKLLKQFDGNNTIMCEHASAEVPGVDLSTGSLGHALPVANGLAIAKKHSQSLHKVYTLISDGELNEGSDWEAFNFAFHHQLNNLCIILDHNRFQGFGTNQEVLDLSPLTDKFEAFGLRVWQVDGHNLDQLVSALDETKKETQKPQIIIADTIKGKGMGKFENTLASHYVSLSRVEKEELLEKL